MNAATRKGYGMTTSNPARGKRRTGFNRKSYTRNWQLYVLLLPTLAYFVILRYMPILGIQIAFKDFIPTLGIWGSPLVGLKHFSRFFSGYYASRLIWNTISLSFTQLILSFPMPILLALLLNEARGQRFMKFAQTISYSPHFLSTVVIVGLLMSLLSPRNGLINSLLMNMGLIQEPVSFMTEEGWFKPLYIMSSIWQETGWNAVVYMAALAGVDTQLYEAARVDGAGRLRCIANITLPSIAPTMITMLILNCGKVMNVGFEKVYLMQNDLNIAAADVISTYVYKMGILQGQYSFSTAVGLFNSVVNTVLVLTVNAISRKVSDSSLW
jgi:putative aldouronate transport system permease protein